MFDAIYVNFVSCFYMRTDPIFLICHICHPICDIDDIHLLSDPIQTTLLLDYACSSLAVGERIFRVRMSFYTIQNFGCEVIR